MKKYRVREDYNFIISDDREAQKIGLELELKFKNQKIHPADVVELAKSPKSALHKYFEWNDKEAAKKYRIVQARRLLKSIVVIIDDQEVPAYFNVKFEGNKSSYLDVMTCKDTPSLWSQVLNNAIKEIEAWKQRYQSYKELNPIHQAIEVVKGDLNGKENKGSRKTRNSKDTATRI